MRLGKIFIKGRGKTIKDKNGKPLQSATNYIKRAGDTTYFDMDDDWIFGSNRLYNAIGKDIYDEILIEGFDKQLVQVNTDGLLKVINLE